MMTLAHISDVHLAPLPPVKPTELLSKRLVGYANWKLRRARTMAGDGLPAMIAHLQASRPDLVAVAGDLTNLALPAEIDRALVWLEGVGDPRRVCAIPGNHDAYVRGALDRATATWGAYMRGETLDSAPFPFVRRIGDVAVICCSSAIATPPWVAAGNFDAPQAERLGRCLRLLSDGGYFRVVMIHHPPNPEGWNARHSLWNARRFRDVVRRHGAELVLHGHTHKSSMHAIAGPGGEIPVVGVAAGGATLGHATDDPARYNLFRIERVGAAWSVTMREFGFQRLGTDIVLRLQMRIY